MRDDGGRFEVKFGRVLAHVGQDDEALAGTGILLEQLAGKQR